MNSWVLFISLYEYESLPIAQAISGGYFDTGIQKLTAIIFDSFFISPQVIKKCLIGHMNSRYSTSFFILISPLLR